MKIKEEDVLLYGAQSLQRLEQRQCGFTNRHRVRISAVAISNNRTSKSQWSSTFEDESMSEQHQGELSRKTARLEIHKPCRLSVTETKQNTLHLRSRGDGWSLSLVLRSTKTKRRTQVSRHLLDRKGLGVASILSIAFDNELRL